MKVLVVSVAAWDRNNNFGKTFCDLFEGMDDVEFLNVYCAEGKPNNRVKAQYFQITMKSMVKNLLKPGEKTGKVVKEGDIETDASEVAKSKMIKSIKAHRWRVFFWGRRFIWWVGRWKSPELIQIVKDYNPDLLFMPIFKETYMNAIQQYLIQLCGKKCVAYYGDDIYSLRMISFNPFFWLDRLAQRRMVKKTVDLCEYMYVVSDIEKEECERDFQKECIVCTKGAVFAKKDVGNAVYSVSKKLVYAGNLGNHRWEELLHIGQALDALGGGHKLYIYSGTPLTAKIQQRFKMVNSIQMMGRVSVDLIPQIYDAADILVHVESFRPQERMLVHQSFSTKIVDYFAHGKCIFGVGAKDVAFVDYLLRRDAAILATSRKEILPVLTWLMRDDSLINEYAKKGYECGRRYHSIEHIQSMLRSDFQSRLDVKS